MNTAYALLRQLLRLLLRVFYGRIDVVGLAHVPATGPLVIAANHSNGLIDSLLLLAIVPRRLVPVAKASLVGHPVLGPVLRALGAIPVHRHRAGDADMRQNSCAIAAAARALQQQRAVLIFPEGVSQPDPVLMPLRTGAARMVLAVETAGARPVGVTVLCIGLLYRRGGTFGNGRAVVRIGPPVPTAVAIAEFRPAPERAIRWLTELIGAGLRAEIAEAEDRQTLELLDLAEALGHFHQDAGERSARMQGSLRAYRHLREHDPDDATGLRGEIARYAAKLTEAGVVPLDMKATATLATAAVAFPVLWLAEAAIVRWRGGWALTALFLASLAPAGLLAVRWHERMTTLASTIRACLTFRRCREAHRDLFHEGLRLRTRLLERAPHLRGSAVLAQTAR